VNEDKFDKLFSMFDWLVEELTRDEVAEPDIAGPGYVVCVTPGWSYTIGKQEDLKFFTIDGQLFALVTRREE